MTERKPGRRPVEKVNFGLFVLEIVPDPIKPIQRYVLISDVYSCNQSNSQKKKLELEDDLFRRTAMGQDARIFHLKTGRTVLRRVSPENYLEEISI